MSNIPNNINREHIVSAIQEIKNNGISNSRRSATEYALLYNDKEYPPKYVISIANKYANNDELSSNDFNSIQSRTFLNNLGFECIKKSNSLKRNFAKWLLDKRQTSYKQYLGKTIESVEFKLDEINNFFPNKDLFLLGNNDFDKIKTFISNTIYGESRSKNKAFFEYDNRNGNGIPKAILGKKNYFVFLDEINLINNKNIETRVEKKLTITHKMDFFTHREFKLLNKYKNTYSDRSNKDIDDTYKELQIAYKKLEYWLNYVQKKMFPNGDKHILKKPTNQGNHFDGYLWAKLYPTRKDKDDKWLAITLGLDGDFHFNIKIDTVGLANNPELLNKYLNYRGDFFKSKIVKRHKSENFKNWEDLMQQTIKDINYLIDFYPEVKKLNASSSNEKNVMKDLKTPKNQILYGPPGTGKTYKTKELAVQISNPNFIYDTNWSITEKREEIVKEYDRLCEKGQIVFTTFHQSMSYEDFVEGIKPKTENEKVTYEVEGGIFKEISLKASQKTISNFKDAYNQLIKEFSDNDNEFLILKTPKEKEFRVRLNSNNNLSLFTTNKSSQQGTFTKEKLEQHLYYENAFNGWEGYANAILNYLKDKFKLSNKGINYRNYTLIIDEINRGNVSAIFGELITLLEDDKRIGQKETIKITLPYSKDEFGVPSNLYIIGTMNTADRSVEALDTALRRRFSFTEVAPDSTLLVDKKVAEIALEKLLQTINDRIELLIDKDHKIGHSYFLNIDTLEDLKQTFKNKVIPLLEEYFFGDYGKIGLVLGSEFITKQDKDKKASFADNFVKEYEDADILREKDVYIFTEEKDWDKEAFISIYKKES